MAPDRWQQISQLYHAALAREASERAAFVRDACGGDDALRDEVESLLAQPTEAAAFLEEPAVAMAAQLVSDPGAPRLTGRRIGVYQLQELLGAGGMGEVYRARDPTLGRDVAIKILPRAFTSDSERLARFDREARMLAALNHPNIGAIHGLEDADGVRALVLELVEGETLAERIARGSRGAAVSKGPGLHVSETLSIARQIADALEAAHEKGIIHRDLKPANIKITPAGVVKVLDFGLAKLAVVDGSSPDLTQSPTVTIGDTRDGMILGTAAYMSPEQARGQAVDKRTDIWAFGCVLYEMLTGRVAFLGATISDTIAAILERNPDWAALPATTPAIVRRLLARCLEKDQKERLRDVGDARIDLHDALTVPATTMEVASSPTGLRRRVSWWATGGITTVVIIGVAVAIAFALRQRESRGASWQNPLANAKFTRLTDFEGSEYDAAISPDGKWVTFLSDRDGVLDVWLSQLGTARFTNLTQGKENMSGAGTTRVLGFSGNGLEIWLAGRNPDLRLRLMPLTGGTPRVFLPEHVVNVAWSPDGTRVVYHTGDPGDPTFVADRTGANASRVFVNPVPGGHNHYPAWSPDGRWIYFVTGVYATREMDLWRIAPSGGAPERLTHHNNNVRYPTPIDARTVLYVSPADDGSGPWLWALDAERNVVHRISFGLEKYESVAASADGRRIVATIANPSAALWSVPILDRPAEERDAKPLPLPTVRAFAPRFGANAMFYLSSRGAGDGLWRYQNEQALEIWNGADGPLREPPAVSSDGRRVAVALRRAGKMRLHLLSADGAELQPMTDAVSVTGTACWSPDDKWIVTGGKDSSGDGLFKVPVGGGLPVRIIAGAALNPVWSPDGSVIAYTGPIVAQDGPLLAVHADGTPVE